LEDALSKRGEAQEVRKTRSPSSTESSSSGPKIKTDPDAENLCRAFDGLNVENDGRVSFHGPTSLFQLPSGVVGETASTSHYEELEGRKERLVNSAWRERAFEQMAAMPVCVLVDFRDVDANTLQEPFQYLLDSHWCWIQPLWNFVYRPAFTRRFDLAFSNI
jgi:hypothetical protein